MCSLIGKDENSQRTNQHRIDNYIMILWTLTVMPDIMRKMDGLSTQSVEMTALRELVSEHKAQVTESYARTDKQFEKLTKAQDRTTESVNKMTSQIHKACEKLAVYEERSVQVQARLIAIDTRLEKQQDDIAKLKTNQVQNNTTRKTVWWIAGVIFSLVSAGTIGIFFKSIS